MNESQRNVFSVLFFLLIFGGLLFYSAFCQLGLTYDSSDYLSAAGDFAENTAMLNQNGSPYIERAPLFPVILSLFGPYKIQAAFWINWFSLLLSIWIFFQLALIYIQSTILKVLFFISVAFSTPLLLIGNFLWSEAFFLALLSGHFYFLHFYFKDQKINTLLGMAGLALLFCLQRNPGVFYVAGTALILLDMNHLWHSFKRASIYALLALSGWSLWTYHCISLGGANFHPTMGVLFADVPGNIQLHLEAITIWYQPLFLSFTFRILIFLGFSLILWLFWQNFKDTLTINQIKFIRSIFMITLVYIFFMSILEKGNLTEVMRYEAINYLQVGLIAFVSLDLLFRNLDQKTTFRYVFIGVLLLWMIYPISRSVKNIQFWHKNQCQTQFPFNN